MTQSIASEKRWPVVATESASRASADAATRGRGRTLLQKSRGVFGDAVLVLLAVWLIPVVVLLVGLPVVLLVRLLLAIAQRM